MTAKENAGGGTGVIQRSADEANEPILWDEYGIFSEALNPFNHKLLPVLPGNEPDPLYEARLLGFSEAWDARQPEVDRLDAEADRLWFRANHSPDEVKEIHRRLVDEGLAEYSRQFMAGAFA